MNTTELTDSNEVLDLLSRLPKHSYQLIKTKDREIEVISRGHSLAIVTPDKYKFHAGVEMGRMGINALLTINSQRHPLLPHCKDLVFASYRLLHAWGNDINGIVGAWSRTQEGEKGTNYDVFIKEYGLKKDFNLAAFATPTGKICHELGFHHVQPLLSLSEKEPNNVEVIFTR